MLGLVWAQAGRVIGRDGGMPWYVPEDLAHFRALTAGSTVVMGRATWQALPERFRPLPGRRNVVLTRDPAFAAPGAHVARSLQEALQEAGGEVWVIGGAQVFAAALPLADRLVVTEIEGALAGEEPGDVLAPAVMAGWELVRRDPPDGWARSRSGPRYRIGTWRRVAAPR